MSMLAIIGGTGLTSLDGLNITEKKMVTTPFGEPSSELLIGGFQDKPVIFLPRHGQQHSIPPHKINYRANIWALHSLGVSKVLAVAAVGGIRQDMAPGVLAVPDQIIDYTYGREHSFFSDDFSSDKHIDFTFPYDETLRQQIIQAAKAANVPIVKDGTYGAVQGPRLETAAEIKRMAQDGCSLVGMTGMPEASLARELNVHYASIALSANWAAGLSDSVITMTEIEQTVADGISQIKKILSALIPSP